MSDQLIVNAYLKGEQERIEKWLLDAPAPAAKPKQDQPQNPYANNPALADQPALRAPGFADIANPRNIAAQPGYDPLYFNRVKDYAGEVGSALVRQFPAVAKFLGREKILSPETLTALQASYKAAGLPVPDSRKLQELHETRGPFTLESIAELVGETLLDPATYTVSASGIPKPVTAPAGAKKASA